MLQHGLDLFLAGSLTHDCGLVDKEDGFQVVVLRLDVVLGHALDSEKFVRNLEAVGELFQDRFQPVAEFQHLLLVLLRQRLLGAGFLHFPLTVFAFSVEAYCFQLRNFLALLEASIRDALENCSHVSHFSVHAVEFFLEFVEASLENEENIVMEGVDEHFIIRSTVLYFLQVYVELWSYFLTEKVLLTLLLF